MNWFHRHKWIVLSANQLIVHRPVVVSGIPLSSFPERQSYETVVLYGCECGNHKTERINGTWTLEELNVGTDSELKELRNMAGLK